MILAANDTASRVPDICGICRDPLGASPSSMEKRIRAWQKGKREFWCRACNMRKRSPRQRVTQAFTRDECARGGRSAQAARTPEQRAATNANLRPMTSEQARDRGRKGNIARWGHA